MSNRFKISISKNSVLISETAFPTIEELNQWFEKYKPSGCFGKAAVMGKETRVVAQAVYEEGEPILIKDAVLDEQGNEIEPAQYEINRILVSPEVVEEVDVELSPAEYQVEITDLTAEIAAQEAAELAKKTKREAADAFLKLNDVTTATTVEELKKFVIALMDMRE